MTTAVRGRVVWSLLAAVLVVAGAVACTPPNPPPPPETLLELRIGKYALSPAFSPGIHDYTIRCTPGVNRFRVYFRSSGGEAQLVAPKTTPPQAADRVTVELLENQAAVVQSTVTGRTSQYWIRCLPHDFPPITTVRDAMPTPGYYLTGVAIAPDGIGAYVMVLDTNGTPVWYRDAGQPGGVDLKQYSPNRLSFMRGQGGYGRDPDGKHQIYDLLNRVTTHVQAVGMPTDFHDFLRLGNGNHMVMSYPLSTGIDLTGLADFGPDETVADCVIQELDPTGALVWEWRASDHVDPLTETTYPTTTGGTSIRDLYHCNSFEVTAAGDVLVSARHLDAVFLISKATGEIVWKLGGAPTNLDGAQILTVQGDPAGGFFRQHDARFLPNGNLTLFDNHTAVAGAARGVEYDLDLGAGTATMVFQHAGPANSQFTGSFRRYPDGRSVVGWGGLNDGSGRAFTEIDAAGNRVFELTFGPQIFTYRTVKVALGALNIDRLRSTAGLP
jgi:hypothetical protein